MRDVDAEEALRCNYQLEVYSCTHGTVVQSSLVVEAQSKVSKFKHHHAGAGLETARHSEVSLHRYRHNNRRN
jgi:hypothetical protein